MLQTVKAIYENGVFKPIVKINLPEYQEVEIVIHEDIPTKVIAIAAEKSGSFDFLNDPGEDVYTINDGEPV